MRSNVSQVLYLSVVVTAATSTAWAQRGVGDLEGVARQASRPAVVTLAGTLMEIKTGPCEQTTGRSPIGTHLLVRTAEGEVLNVHLGPQTAVADVVAKLGVGQTLRIEAFRTEKMADRHYTAQSLRFGDTAVELRDDGLRPVWSGGPGPARTTAALPTQRGNAASHRGAGAGFGRGGGGPPWASDFDGRRGRGADAAFATDRDTFHSLLNSHQAIRRSVTPRSDGVETQTESDDPAVAVSIQQHVAAMHQRVKSGQPIHMRDPLFAAIFSNVGKIHMEITNTAKGARVIETSDDPYVVKLIQAHAEVVSKFVANGFGEARQNHPVPAR